MTITIKIKEKGLQKEFLGKIDLKIYMLQLFIRDWQNICIL